MTTIGKDFTIEFADGSSFTGKRADVDDNGDEIRGTGWRQASIDSIVGVDANGELVGKDAYSGFLATRTQCCGAVDKGIDDGIVCRACYRECWLPRPCEPIIPVVTPEAQGKEPAS